MKEFADFAVQTLVPAVQDILRLAFAAHQAGQEMDIVTKGDNTAASRADREAEQVLRGLIGTAYPEHGIIGEEFGAEKAEASYVWVLDPLDGTREFLAKEAGWGTLIALLHRGKPVLGVIHDSINGLTWPRPEKAVAAQEVLSRSSVACTSPDTMFDGTPWQDGAARLFRACRDVRPRLNCLGFSYVADGSVDLAAEGSLKLHDIAALLPVLWQAGADCRTAAGASYRDYVFDLSRAATESYTLVTSRHPALVRQAVAMMGGAA